MKQALILCGGKARRLSPYSYGLPKASMPFLNLPLLSLGWFYLEQLGVSRFLLNSHLFPEKLKRTVNFLSQAQQKTEIFFESEPLGGAGTLYKLKKFLQKEEIFFYLNGDSLFFPSSKDQFSLFEKDFFQSKADGSFFALPIQLQDSDKGFLWCDKDLNLRFVGKKDQLSKEFKGLLPFHFSGLALFKSALLENLDSSSFHLFEDFIKPAFKRGNFKVFLDREARILEGGEKSAYLESIKFCLNALFRESNGEIKKLLLEYFSRFDPEDKLIGFKNGRTWSKKMGFPLLAPASVRGLGNLSLKGPAVLGPGVHLFGKSRLKDSILGSDISWRGELNNRIVLKFLPEK